jgi:hypothetical protein
MAFGTGNVRSLYRSGLFATVARELARYKSDLLGIQEIKWDKRGTVRVRDNFFYDKGNENHKLGKGLFVYHRTVSQLRE